MQIVDQQSLHKHKFSTNNFGMHECPPAISIFVRPSVHPPVRPPGRPRACPAVITQLRKIENQ